nr:MAG: ORF1 [Torque teno virus]
MAWGWWKRRRRGWWRRLWTRRRRAARRRPRWTARRPRRRRVRRRRRWRRGRRRRKFFRRRRRLRRKRRKPKIVIKEWQPDTVRRCRIIGYIPLIISGQGTFATNFSSHLEDRISKGPFGGGHSTMRFSLFVLYQEHLRHMNFWTRSNDELELTRYLGATITVYRHPDQDFLIVYNRKSPLGGNIYTAPSLHPGNAMLAKHKIIVPSLETRKRGRKKIKIRIAPPTLFVDKWYFQKDICDLTLFNLNAVAVDLRFPFCSPQTDNTCVTFQVLQSVYNEYLSITAFDGTSKSDLDTPRKKIEEFLNKAFPGTREHSVNALNTFRTEGCMSHPKIYKFKPDNPESQSDTQKYFATKDALWGDAIYIYSDNTGNTTASQNLQTVIKRLAHNPINYYQKMLDEKFPNTWLGNPAHTHLTGIFSPPYLSQGRISPEIPGLYTEIIYNPYTDKGKGNRIWVDYCTKPDNIYKEGQSKCLLQDMPLWTLVFGYQDWVKKELNNWVVAAQTRVLIVSPYTVPKLYHDNNPDYGFVPFSYKFGEGRMPDGSSYVPIQFRGKWYPTMLHQQQVFEDIARSGPFAPKQNKPSIQLVAKYKFDFNWGGNPISTQVVRDPCTQSTFEIPGGGVLPRRIQVINPKVLGPSYSFKSFDIRRGLFSTQSIKRVSEQYETSEFLFSGPKRPKIDLPKYEPPEEGSGSVQRQERPWSTDTEETEAEAQEEEETVSVREQLQLQFQEQLRIRQGIKHLFEQLVRTQQGVHVNPSLV